MEHIEDEFRFGKIKEPDLSQELDHDWIETGKCSVINNFKFLAKTIDWENLKSVIKIESKRDFKNSEKPAIRYYISSMKTSP